jgi:hypothetical protein
MAILKNTTVVGTESLQLPVGNTAQRPASPVASQMRYNTTTAGVEIYTGGTNIWQSSSTRGVRATGGTVYDVEVEGTTFRVHVFTTVGNSTFTVSRAGVVEYLIVAGGGGGGNATGTNWGAGGGGGAGGLLTGFSTLTPQAYTVTVGAGGAGATQGSSANGTNGSNSVFNALTAVGGGAGASANNTAGSGGSGGGQGYFQGGAGTGTAGQGFAGATNGGVTPSSGGGGGAGQVGFPGADNLPGRGGQGLPLTISGNMMFYAGGGGGGYYNANLNTANGGGGGGGNGGRPSTSVSNAGLPGTPNTGGGGGGGSGAASLGAGAAGAGGAGGSGIVIIRYPLQSEPDIIAPRVSNNNLVLDLDFGQSVRDLNTYNSPLVVINDAELNGFTGTLANGTSTFGLRSTRAGLLFDGADDRLNTNLFRSFNQFLSVECWYRGTRTSRNHLWNFVGENLHCNFNDGIGLWMYWNGSGGNRVRYNGNFTDGLIKHLVFTHGGSTNKVYLNGVELPIADQGGTQTFSNIGAGGFNVGDTPFGGEMFILRIYESELSAAEVAGNFNATRWRFGV